MNTPSVIEDNVLSAWLDGELEPARRAEVEAWLQQHPEAAARVRLWSADRDALRARFASVVDEPVPQPLARSVWARQGYLAGPVWPLAAAVAAFVIGGVAGSFGGWQWRGQYDSANAFARAASPAGWVQRAALAHRVYAAEQRHPVEVNLATTAETQRSEQEAHLQQWLTRRVDLPVKLFDLRAEGFTLVGGRLLPDGPNGVSALLMYEQPGGARVTVTLRRAAESVPAAFRFERQGDVGLFYWVEGRAGYALAGALPRERLLALAQSIYAQQPTIPAESPR
ncbi:MAG: anti-sigma factor [Burkholderiales bacterium]|nr:MAG: anti-sigma factor [Burkholderiales bacterium]